MHIKNQKTSLAPLTVLNPALMLPTKPILVLSKTGTITIRDPLEAKRKDLQEGGDFPTVSYVVASILKYNGLAAK